MLVAALDVGSPLALLNSHFPHGRGPIFLDFMACTGNEEKLIDCRRNAALGRFSCSHQFEAGVKCPGKNIYHCELTIKHLVLTDINECLDNELHDCDNKPNEECRNTVGSFECHCREGFKRDIDRMCIRKFLIIQTVNIRKCRNYSFIASLKALGALLHKRKK